MYGSLRSYMTDRQRLTWHQTFFKRVISLSTARWFFSLLNEQWWRERSADGLVTELRVTHVRGHRVAVEEDFSLWVVEVVDHVGLITCERGVVGPRARLLIWRSSAVFVDRTWPERLGIEQEDVSGKGVEWESKRNAQVQAWMTWRWDLFSADDTILESWANAYKVVNCACTETTACINVNSFCEQLYTKHVLLKWKDRHSILTWNRTKELYKNISRYLSRTCWEPQIQVPTRSFH